MINEEALRRDILFTYTGLHYVKKPYLVYFHNHCQLHHPFHPLIFILPLHGMGHHHTLLFIPHH